MSIEAKHDDRSGVSPNTLYQQIGGMETCQRLSERFHSRIADDPILSTIFPENLAPTTKHLALFLAQHLGGPAEYTAQRGKNSLVCRHAHLPIGTEESERWLRHMYAAIEEVGLPESARKTLKDFFTHTIPTLSDPFLPYYHLPLDELQAVLKQNPMLADSDKMGRNLLSKAAGAWDLPRVQMLLEHGADVNVQNRMGHDALYYAANAMTAGRAEEGRAVVTLLIQHGANVNSRSGPGRMTALHMAARRGTSAIAETLLAFSAEIEAKDTKGETPLRRAVNCGQAGVVHTLLAHGADSLSQDRQGRTPLDAARQEPIRQALQEAILR